MNFNLCHWLRVDGDKDYRPILRENAEKIQASYTDGILELTLPKVEAAKPREIVVS